MNRQDLRVIKTKESIQNALLQLLKEKSLEKINVTEICHRARVNRGTFYLHYRLVEDVFTELFQDIVDDMKIAYGKPYKGTNPFSISNLDPKAICIFEHIKNHQLFYEVVFSKHSSNFYYYMLFDKIRTTLQSNFKSQNQSEINTEYYIGYQVNAIMGVILVWFEHGLRESPEEMNKQLYYILRENFAT